MPSFTIRDASKADIDGLCRLEAAAFQDDRLSSRSLRHLLTAPSARLRVARAGGAVVGYHLILTRRGTQVARLYSIAVDAAQRGKGLATALMADAEAVARRAGRAVLRLEVRADNRAAIRLYERLGYRLIGRYQAYYADKADALRYEKPLGRGSAGDGVEADEDRSPPGRSVASPCPDRPTAQRRTADRTRAGLGPAGVTGP
jgi:[ribosomal protein S18]-alanine N-acetyltransferase